MTVSLSRAACSTWTHLFKEAPLFKKSTMSFNRSFSLNFGCQTIAFRPFSQSKHLLNKGRSILLEASSDKSRTALSMPALKSVERYFSTSQIDNAKFQFPSEEVLLKQLSKVVPSIEQQVKLAKFLANSSKTKAELNAEVLSIIGEKCTSDSVLAQRVLTVATHDIVKDLLLHCLVPNS